MVFYDQNDHQSPQPGLTTPAHTPHTPQSPKQNTQVYPDAGVAAMLSYQWRTGPDAGDEPAGFRLSSLNDRRPVQAGDAIVIMACPDPPGADDALRIIRQVGWGGGGGGKGGRR